MCNESDSNSKITGVVTDQKDNYLIVPKVERHIEELHPIFQVLQKKIKQKYDQYNLAI